VAAAVAFVLFILAQDTPISEELYCNKTSDSCKMISRYFPGRIIGPLYEETYLMPYGQVAGVEAETRYFMKETFHDIVFTLQNGRKFPLFYNFYTPRYTAESKAEYLDWHFKNQTEEIRLKNSLFEQ
jgi:hypothetical protein